MKRFLLLLPLLLPAAAGCLSTETLGWKHPVAETPPKAPTAAPPGVQPEEINESNAASKLAGLRAEIEYDANEKTAPKAVTPSKQEPK
jgi:hypothetical protein